MNELFPMGRWIHTSTYDNIKYLYERSKKDHTRALVMKIALFDVSLRDPMEGFPYLMYSKCRSVVWPSGDRWPYYDNGRIIAARYLETTVTNLDLEIIERQYNYTIDYIEAMHCKTARMPEPWQRLTMSYYKRKTELKGLTDDDSLYYYQKAKNLLNSIYGLTVQDPLKDIVYFDEAADDLYITEGADRAAYMDRTIRNPVNYGHGVFTTAWQRYRLQEILDIVGPAAVYCDTDSVKYIDDMLTDTQREAIRKINADLRARSVENGATATDRNGGEHPMQVYEDDGEYSQFITMGAKKYAYTDMDGGFHITIAGVPKLSGAREMGDINNFREGFTFRNSGKLRPEYHDRRSYGQIEIHSHRIELIRNVTLRPVEYRLGLTGEYQRLIDNLPDQ